VTGDGQRMCATLRNIMRSVRSGGGAETTTADEARRTEGARCSSLPLPDRGRLGTVDASGGSSDSSDALEPRQTHRKVTQRLRHLDTGALACSLIWAAQPAQWQSGCGFARYWLLTGQSASLCAPPAEDLARACCVDIVFV